MRIGIVNDIAMVLEGLRRIVAGMQGLEVAWLARNGADAVTRCCEDPPDLVLMDLILPDFDGAEATRRIMQQCPCPILVVTASVKANQSIAFEALSAGAMDVVATPAVVPRTDDTDFSSDAFESKVRNVLRIIRSVGSTVEASAGGDHAATDHPLIAIGASTGGPKAVVTVLSALPKRFSAAVVVIIHVNKEFAAGMAKWMSDMTGLAVNLAAEGQAPVAGEVLLAATNEHLVLTCDQVFRYIDEPKENPFRPSVDVFFSSVVKHWKDEAVGVLLTGMGNDGAKGLLEMRQHGWHTIAQDQQSSVIYGMPKAAARLGAASQILDLERIGPALVRRIGSNGALSSGAHHHR